MGKIFRTTPHIHQLKADIASFKQENLDVVKFFSKLMGLWSERDNFVKYPRCTCDAAAQIRRRLI